MSTSLSIGSRAPDFTLRDQDGELHTLSDSRGSYTLLYFYPKDDTPGCTTEACVIAEALPDFAVLNANVFGISVDSVESHKKFAGKHQLSLTLLSDEDMKVVQAYGVWGTKKFMGKEYEGTSRTSFLVDPKGTIVKIYEDVDPDRHASDVLIDVAALSAE